MAWRDAVACVADVGEKIKAFPPGNEYSLYFATVSAKNKDSVTVIFKIGGECVQKVCRNWEVVKLQRHLTERDFASIGNAKKQQTIIEKIVAECRRFEAEEFESEEPELKKSKEEDLNALVKELEATGLILTMVELEKIKADAGQWLKSRREELKNERMEEVKKSIFGILNRVELKRFGQDGLGELTTEVLSEVEGMLAEQKRMGMVEDIDSLISQLQTNAKHFCQAEASRACSRAFQDFASVRLHATGQRSVNNTMNEAAFLACMKGDVEALQVAAGGCFACFKVKEEYSHDYSDGAGTWEEYEPIGHDFGSYFVPLKPEFPKGLEDGMTLLKAAKVVGWSESIICTLERIGVRLSSSFSEPAHSVIVNMKHAPEAGTLLTATMLSGEEFQVSVREHDSAAGVGEEVRWLKGLSGDTGVKIMVDGRVLAPQEDVLQSVNEAASE